ncbi:enoyl-CoA hydratase/isomerase family protein [Aliikangiella coralliicola]|uniref:Enoyl-CoA hydratase/isomerase family protein n=2 Tax=Aliikangiella coralliicola TaxID=2592383 RepID=A0A545UDV7_9GAMM|nr:enoyl-CoA hydratase/isomerase family protein [Aliikangiella coralliicola]TQV87655.1 enoyl-CoA hydratase/isomerase family protein [Aliikangiella coralliicola]
MSEPSLAIEKRNNGIATITLNRPQIHNAFDDKVIAELTEAVSKLDQDDSVRIIVLAANGKSFSAGADLNWMKRMAGYSWEQNYQDSLQLAGLMQTIHDASKTTVAVVQGAAFGGGVGLVACCDIALASEKALFCLSEVKLGLIPSVISPYVVKAIGERNAKRYFATAERFDATEAKHINLIHKIFPHDALTENVEDFLQKALANGPKAMYQAKKLVNLVHNQPINEDLIRETAQRIADIRASKEGKEGVGAFLEKRPANWSKTNDNESSNIE